MILLHHDSHTDQEIYACHRMVKKVSEGSIEHMFDDEDDPNVIPVVVHHIEEAEALN